MSGDPIDEYVAALRAGLRTPPARTAEILAEAEDLRTLVSLVSWVSRPRRAPAG